jgi:hypothetical protein
VSESVQSMQIPGVRTPSTEQVDGEHSCHTVSWLQATPGKSSDVQSPMSVASARSPEASHVAEGCVQNDVITKNKEGEEKKSQQHGKTNYGRRGGAGTKCTNQMVVIK